MYLTRNKAYTLLKWIVLLAACGFLVFKLAHIGYWEQLRTSFASLSMVRAVFIVAVVVLMPLNWMLEARKWQMLTRNISRISFLTSLKAVLAGLNTGYITPNRIGEFAGRILFLPPGKRITGIMLSLLNSLTQNLIITVFGVAGAVVYFSDNQQGTNFGTYLVVVSVVFAFAAVFYFFLPSLSRKTEQNNRNVKIAQIAHAFTQFEAGQLLKIIGISAIRYFVFGFQFYLMLRFFDIGISATQAITAIPVMYLLVTFTPSFAASEPAIRSSLAVFVLGAFSANTVGIILTGILVWLINFVVPMIAGAVVTASSGEETD